MSEQQAYEEAMYKQQKAWEEEQEHLASESAEAEAMAEENNACGEQDELLLTPEAVMKDVLWSAMTCAYKNALEHPGEGLLNFYTPESFVAELQVKLAKVKQHYEQSELKEMICSKCGDQVGRGLGSLQGKIVNGKLQHIKCPTKKVVTKKGLDRPELREKIERLEINFCFALLAFDAGHIHKDEMDLHRDYLIDQILALIPDIEEAVRNAWNSGYEDGKAFVSINLPDLLEEAKKQERERIACEMEETIYNQVRHLQTKIDEHPWSRQQTNYDSKFIGYIDKSLLQIGNALYSFRQTLKGESK